MGRVFDCGYEGLFGCQSRYICGTLEGAVIGLGVAIHGWVGVIRWAGTISVFGGVVWVDGGDIWVVG